VYPVVAPSVTANAMLPMKVAVRVVGPSRSEAAAAALQERRVNTCRSAASIPFFGGTAILLLSSRGA
jgi:hypothetical protein